MTLHQLSGTLRRAIAIVLCAVTGLVWAAPLSSAAPVSSAGVEVVDAAQQTTTTDAETDAKTDADATEDDEAPSGIAAISLIISVTALIISGIAVIISLRRPNPATIEER